MRHTYLVILLTLGGCSLVSDFGAYHLAEHDGGGADGGAGGAWPRVADGGSSMLQDGGAAEDAGAQADSDSGSDSGATFMPDSGGVVDGGADAGAIAGADAGADAGPVYPHGCTPPLLYCMKQDLCVNSTTLSGMNNMGHACGNCTFDANVMGFWVCL
jgi:hypothetical protein